MAIGDWDDMTLMRALGEGEIEALGELVHRYQQRALGLAYRMLGRWDAAEDAVQDAFLQVYRAAPRYRPQAEFITWLYRIVTNRCLVARRREKRAPEPLTDERTPASGTSPAQTVETDEAVRRVRQAVQALPERQRAALILHRYERLSYFEVAQVTGWSESAVESLLVRAYAALRKMLAEPEKKNTKRG